MLCFLGTLLFHNKNSVRIRNTFPLRTLLLVEVTGFEPAAFWSRTKRATKLRYTSYGANVGTRTPDLLITNQLLYQLSYIGLKLPIFRGFFSRVADFLLSRVADYLLNPAKRL
jgi:hypothetical protein